MWFLFLEIPYDGVDQDGDGQDLVDLDRDGFASTLVGGADCDDRNPQVHPGRWDIPHDGVDADCDGDDPDRFPRLYAWRLRHRLSAGWSSDGGPPPVR